MHKTITILMELVFAAHMMYGCLIDLCRFSSCVDLIEIPRQDAIGSYQWLSQFILN